MMFTIEYNCAAFGCKEDVEASSKEEARRLFLEKHPDAEIKEIEEKTD